MNFTKMNGAGNDFIIINNIEEKISEEKFPEIVKCLCTRRMSIGADGFMVVDKSINGADYKMTFYNSDGSIGEMCGNGARCIARYGYENSLAGLVQKIETTAGLVTGYRIDDRKYKVKLNNPTTIKIDEKLSIDDKEYEYSYVELGNPGIPHAVVECKNLKDMNRNQLKELGRKIRNYNKFPKGANVNFYDIVESQEVVDEITFERGVEDFTFACGTGSGSVALVLTLKKLVDGKNVNIKVPGGDLYIDIIPNTKDNKEIEIYLTGPTNIVAVGQVKDEDLEKNW